MDICLKAINNGYLLEDYCDYNNRKVVYFASMPELLDHVLANYNIDPHTPTTSTK